jgi:hypothetical protein
MQIHEITKRRVNEGLWGDIKSLGKAVASKEAGKGFIQGLTGVDLPQAQPTVDIEALKTAAAAATPATERIVVSVSQPDQTIPAKYFKTKDVWTNEDGQQITNPKSIAYLDKLIPTHGKKETIAPPITTRKVSRRRNAR